MHTERKTKQKKKEKTNWSTIVSRVKANEIK